MSKELFLSEPQVWIPELELELGLWPGEYRGINRLWLHWYNAEGHWILTEAEYERQRAADAEQRAADAEQRAARLTERLRAMGINPDAE
jgi:hypothetical protein